MNASSPAARPAAVVFDLDGTLAHTIPATYAAFRAVFARRTGRTYADAELRAMFGPDERGVFARGLPGDDPDDALEEFLAAFDAGIVWTDALFPGVRDLLERLAERGTPAAIVTGKGARSAALCVERLGLGSLVRHIGHGSASGSVKTTCMRRVCAAFRTEPHRVVSIGDSPYDVRDARAVGLAAHAAAWAPGTDVPALAREEPDGLHRDVAAFAAVVLRDRSVTRS